MNPGRELDALIAEKVLDCLVWCQCNWVKDTTPPFFRCHDCNGWVPLSVPHYSTDISAAWEVVEKLRVTRGEVEIRSYNKVSWTFVVDEICYEVAETAPHAICLAALKAVGK